MLHKAGDYGTKAVSAVAGAAAAYAMRKALAGAWTKIAGRKPPEKAEDPKVGLGEAITWAVLVSAGVAVARVLAVRLAARQGAFRPRGTPEPTSPELSGSPE